MSGNGETSDPILNVLQEIKVEIQGVQTEVRGVKTEVQGLQAEMRSGFAELNNRIDNVLQGQLGERVRDHEERIRALEKRRK